VVERLLDAALSCAARGWGVFPLYWIRDGRCSCGRTTCSAGKHPLTDHGFDDASTGTSQIQEWWTAWPSANIGVLTGAASGLVVLDVDGVKGELSLRGLQLCNAPLPETLWVRTGSGWHAYFSHPGIRVPNSAGRLAIGLDVRGDGGYVVAPPSGHINGTSYVWANDAEPAQMPSWLLRRALPQPVVRQKRARRSTTADAAETMAGECSAVARSREGTRNDRLNLAAFRAGMLVRDDQIAEDHAFRMLYDAARTCGLGEWEAARTIRSGMSAGIAAPERRRA
jgi:hypothetical protein